MCVLFIQIVHGFIEKVRGTRHTDRSSVARSSVSTTEALLPLVPAITRSRLAAWMTCRLECADTRKVNKQQTDLVGLLFSGSAIYTIRCLALRSGTHNRSQKYYCRGNSRFGMISVLRVSVYS